MVKCETCGKNETFPYKCKYCDNYFCPDHRLPESHNCHNMPPKMWPNIRRMECYVCHREPPHISLYVCRQCGLRYCSDHAPQEQHNCQAPIIQEVQKSPLKEVPLKSRISEKVCFVCEKDSSLLLCPYCYHSFCSEHRWDKKRHRCMGSRESLTDLKKRDGISK